MTSQDDQNAASEALKEAQRYLRSLVGPDVSLVDELIAERREEAAREHMKDLRLPAQRTRRPCRRQHQDD